MADERPPYYLERPDAPPPSFGAVAQSGILPEFRQAQSEYQEAQKQRAKRVGERIAEEKQAITAVPHEAPPAAETLPKPPSVGLTPFLAPVEGERPENTIAKLIQGVGLLATGVAGRKDARASLAALTGALKGWQEGDKERADRHFADWQAQSETLLKNWQAKRSRWKDLMEDRSLTIQERARLWELDMLKEGVELDPLKAQLEGAQYLQGLLDKQQAHADMVSLARDKLNDMNERAARHDETLRAIAAGKREDAEWHREELLAQYTPEVLRSMGQQWALKGTVQTTGLRGKDGELILGMIRKAGIDWAREQGIDPMSLPGIQATVASARSALTDTMKKKNFALANAAVFERHLDSLIKLSETVDRSQIPAINDYILKGRTDWSGDPRAGTYIMQSFEVAMEFSKLMVGSAQGDEASRAEARKAIATKYTHEQLVDIARQLKVNAANRIAGWDETIKSSTDIINDAGKARSSTPAASPGGGETKTINVPGVGAVKVTVTP